VDRARLIRAVDAAAAVGAVGAVAATAHTAVNLRLLRTPDPSPAPVRERVSILVPARDEAARIGPCIASLLESEGLPDVEVVVLDDGSSDGTADVVRRVAAGDPRLCVVDGGASPVPHGWLGKTWACHRLAEQATGSVLVFVDADVRLSPQGIAASVQLLRTTGLDLVCPYPRQLADGALPRLVQPLLQWSWATTLPLRAAETSPRETLVAANGQLLVVDRAAYDRAGGHAGIRSEVLDDVALLRAVKRSGGRGVVADGTDVAVCRMLAAVGAVLYATSRRRDALA
jgi:glycosyltransferase involved in cell wall biosynthesis